MIGGMGFLPESAKQLRVIWTINASIAKCI